MDYCNNCNREISGKYCSNCGQPARLKRIDSHYIIHEITHVLHFEKGVFFTIRELLFRPGKNIREFISINRSRLVKPVIFIIISSLIYSLLNHFFHIEDGYINFSDSSLTAEEAEKSTSGKILHWIQSHYGYANIIMGVFISVWLKLFFRKHQYNIFELLILLCFVLGIGMLIISLFTLFQGLTGIQVMQGAGVLLILYCSWAIGQFFGQDKFGSYFKAFAAYILGMLTFTFAALLTGLLFDLFKL
jgi:hypothetical protein